MHSVLIVEDEKLVREGLARTVDWEKYGLRVVGSCANGLEGLDAAHTLSPDLIICDIRMPKMTGLEMLKRLRSEGSDVEVIFLTAYSDFSYARDALRLLAADYLLKPFEDEELDAAIRKIALRRGWDQDGNAESGKQPQEAIAPNLRDPETDNVYCVRAMKYVKEHYGEKDLSVSRIAGALSISDGYLSRTFKSAAGMTPGTYITTVRIRNAMSLLKMRAYKVYEVADMCGYSDLAYFSSTFRKYTGVSPTEFQNQEERRAE